LLFPEYFHGEDGRGLGASHQGWTALVAKLIQQSYLARDEQVEAERKTE
jgi:copper oxidase (laccase) domain-containing protein